MKTLNCTTWKACSCSQGEVADDLWSPADNLPEMEEDDEEYWEVLRCNLLSPYQSIVTPG